MSTQLSAAARLHELLRRYEDELELTELSAFERDVLFAFQLVREDHPNSEDVRLDEVKGHPTLANIAHATFYRAVRSLTDRGLLQASPCGRRRQYRITMS